jgi:hypothetical protein
MLKLQILVLALAQKIVNPVLLKNIGSSPTLALEYWIQPCSSSGIFDPALLFHIGSGPAKAYGIQPCSRILNPALLQHIGSSPATEYWIQPGHNIGSSPAPKY